MAVVGDVELINGWISGGAWLPLIAAPFIGSFLGVMIRRVPEGRDFAWSRSVCDSCGRTLAAKDLVPLASFAALRGRCRFCTAPIGWFHPAVEVCALGVALWAWGAGARGAQLSASCALGWTLLALGWIDARCQRLPDFLTLPLLLGGLAEAGFNEPASLIDRAVGAVAAYLGFRLLAVLFRRFRGREGLGEGDAKLLAAGGAWVGAIALPDVLLVAAGTALLFALRRLRADPAERIPFGPFLAAGIWLLWLYG
jgi:leader peptidase (prepilin peptidase)/N-methyltransferase